MLEVGLHRIEYRVLVVYGLIARRLIGIDLPIVFDDQPFYTTLSRHVCYLFRCVRIVGNIEKQNRKYWSSSGRVINFFFQAEDGIRVGRVTGVQTCALPI